MKSIFDASFKYSPSFDTDVRRTFDRIRREEQAKSATPPVPASSHPQLKVLPLDLPKQASA